MNLVQDVLQRLVCTLPTACIVCARNVNTTENLCRECLHDLPWIKAACSCCGEYSHLPLTKQVCTRCELAPPPFRFCKGIFRYEKPVNVMLSGFKFNARFEAGFALGSQLARHMRDHYLSQRSPDLLLPIPLHPNRLRERGYNQATEIAKLAASSCNIPLQRQLLIRERNTVPQTETGSARNRLRNLQGAFRVAEVTELQNVKSIAIIDDVVTTMATIIAATKALQSAGVENVEIWCVARASREL